MAVGAALIAGRAAGTGLPEPSVVNRYGGVQISMRSSYVPRIGFEPAIITVASGSSSATEWYRRGYWATPADDHVSVAGSKRSAARLALPTSSLTNEPPLASTLPLGRITALIWMRGSDIGGSERHAGDVCDRSIISAVAVAGLLPPMIMTRGA